MKLLSKTLFLLAFCLLANLSFSQIYKMEQAVEDKNFKKLEKVALSALEDKALKKKPEVYYYLAQAYIEQSMDEILFSKNPDAVKLATKYMLKGIKKDENRATLSGDFEKVLEKVIKRQIEEAERQYKIKKMSKSVKMFKYVIDLDSTNRYAHYMVGKSHIANLDSALGEQSYKRLISWYNEDLKTGNKENEKTVDPHAYFIDKYWQAGNYDSAKFLIKNGREIFDDNAKLNYYDVKVTYDQIQDMAPSELLLDYIQEVLVYSPDDKDFLHKENAVYIYLIKNKLNKNEKGSGDLMINRFVREKVAKSALKDAMIIKNTDIFVEKKPENVLWKLTQYFQENGHLMSSEHMLNRYISQTAKDTTEEATADRWYVITNYAFKTMKLPFSGFVLQQAIARYPDNKSLLDSRKEVIAEREVAATDVDEQGALYLLMKDEFSADSSDDNKKRLLAINDKYVGLLAAANRFNAAKSVMKEQTEMTPNEDHSERLRYLAREDFYQNYFLTRTKGKDLDGNTIKAFDWNGSASVCDEGSIDMDIQEKVADRINYFRRNAGVPEVLLDAATNEICQKAALMMTSNKSLDHEPPRTWRCWTNDGFYAAKHSLLIQDANTSMAVTYIMDDQNPAAGNRRWLLYPNGKVYGHGSTNNVAVIWALDDSGSTDTTQYMDQPVSWPPEGDVPQMMLFKNWTFSIYRDLKDATVEVLQDGKALDVNVESFVRDYGAPTLVFQPKFDKGSLPDKSNFKVTVTLSDGRKYMYTVRSFYYNPGK